MHLPTVIRCGLLTAAIGVSLMAANPSEPSAPAAAPINFSKSIADQLEPTRTQIYKVVDGWELRLDVFLPADFSPGDQRIGLVAFHGGGWAGGTPRSMYPFCTWASERGMVGISVQYRRYKPDTPVTVFTCVQDARSAVRYVRSHAAELGIDPHHLVAIGSSAGGHLAVSTALFDYVNESTDDLTISCRPDALILVSPVIDTSAEGYGQAKIGERWRELSPVHNVRPGLPPTLLFHGSGDDTTPFAGAVAFAEAMQAAHIQCEAVFQPEGRHVYMMKEQAAYEDGLDRIDRFISSLDWPLRSVP